MRSPSSQPARGSRKQKTRPENRGRKGQKGAGASGPADEPLAASLYLDLTASILGAGLPLPRVLEELGRVDQGRYRAYLEGVLSALYAGADWNEAWPQPRPEALEEVRTSLDLSLKCGAPSAQMIRVLAQRQRRAQQRRYEKSAARLAVCLVLPLGVCSLPSFICLGVIPVLLSLFPTVF